MHLGLTCEAVKIDLYFHPDIYLLYTCRVTNEPGFDQVEGRSTSAVQRPPRTMMPMIIDTDAIQSSLHANANQPQPT
jgi:hypothetical protein